MKKTSRSISLVGLLAAGCCFSLCGQVVAQADDPRIKKIFADWKKRQEAIKVVQYRIEGNSVIPKGSFVDEMMKPLPKPTPARDIEAKVSRTILLDFARGRFRFETHEPRYDANTDKLFPETTIKTFDGKTGKQWRPRELNTHPLTGLKPTTPELGIGTGFFGGIGLGIAWRPLFLGHGSVPCEGEARVNLDDLLVQPDPEILYIHGEGVQQGRACWILRTRARKMAATGFTELWVDKSRASAILRHAYLINGVPLEQFEISYREAAQGWLPEKWTYTSRNLQNKGSVDQLESMAVAAIAVDPPLVDSEFDIPITPGFLTAQISYSEPRPGEPPYRAKSATKLIRIEKDGSPREVEIVDGVERRLADHSWRVWVAVSITAAVSCAFWALWRFAKRGKNKA